MKRVIWVIGLGMLAVHRCGTVRAENITTGEPDILVSIVMHAEEVPQYETNATLFWQLRNALVNFARGLAIEGVSFNFQSDWTFLKGAGLHDTGTPQTNGKNVVRWMKEDLGFEIDPHAHESTYNHADVAYLIEALGVPPSGIVGGMIVEPPEDSILEQFRSPIVGWQYPSYSWQAEVTWGGATGQHVNEESLWTSGVWKPKDKWNFLVHDDAAPLPNIGGYHTKSWAGLDRLIQLRENCQLRAGRIYTCTIMVAIGKLREPGYVTAFMDALRLRKATPGVRWIGLQAVLDTWYAEYGGQANQLAWLAGDGQIQPDFDGDGDVDASDFQRFADCRTGPRIPYAAAMPADCTLVPNCDGLIPADLDRDGDTDLSDFGIFQRCLSGPGVPYHPACVE